MFHPDRAYRIVDLPSAAALVAQLRQPQPLDLAFRVVSTVFANDSASPHGPQVYAVVRDGLELDAIVASSFAAAELHDFVVGVLATSTFAYPGALQAEPVQLRITDRDALYLRGVAA